MEFRVLGSMQICTNRGQVRLVGDRQRLLLATLLVSFDRAVSVPHLVDAVWGQAPPATAKRQVQNCLSALRRQLQGEVIVAEGGGYRLPATAGDLDAHTFRERTATARRLVAADRHADALAELRAGLALWRGPAFDGLTGQVVEAAAAGLNEERLAATEECLELELRAGRHREVIGELTELVAAHPLRERLVGQLMTALHRSGRPADALRAYHDLRARLADELALDPGAAIREVYLAVLNNEEDPAPRTAGPVPAQLPADVAGFAGRGAGLSALDGLGPLSVITGMAGVGKTALAVHWGHRARDRFPDGQLYVNLRGFDPSGSAMGPDEAVRGFLDALGVPPDRVPASLSAQTALYRSLLSGRRMLVVLDNARDADQVRPMVPGSPTCQVLITSRSGLAGLVAGEGARPVELDALGAGEARDLLARRLGVGRVAAEPAAVDEIVTRCAGLPLALAVVAARAAAHPGFPLTALAAELRDTQAGLDAFDGADPATDMRAVFSWSYRALSAPAARLFRLLALHPGPDVSAAAATSLAGGPSRQPGRALAELVGAHLIAEPTPRRYALHDLLRAYAVELVARVDGARERRAALHRLFDHYLHTGYAAARLQHPHRHPITLSAPSAGVTVERLPGPEQALAWFAAEHRVLQADIAAAAQAGLDGHAWRLAWTVAEFLDRRGLWHSWAANQRVALRAARRAADPAGEAHAHRSLGRAYLRLDRVDDAVFHLGQAHDIFEAAGDGIGQARTLLDLGWASDRREQPAQALGYAQRALAVFRAAGDRPGQADALGAVGAYHAALGDLRRALDQCRQALAVHRQLGYLSGQASTLVRLGGTHHQLGDHGQAATHYRDALELYHRIGVRHEEALVLTALGDAQLADGAPSAARQSWQRALAILTELGHPDTERVDARLRRSAPRLERSGRPSTN